MTESHLPPGAQPMELFVHSEDQSADGPATDQQATIASVPPMVGNVAVGFDVLGHSFDGPRDQVIMRRREEPGVVLSDITGDHAGRLNLADPSNTALAAVAHLLAQYAPDRGLVLQLVKQIPVAAGMGGSAASAIAAVVAANKLLELGLSVDQCAISAMAGERLASGGANWDNIYPALLGGLVLVVNGEQPQARIVSVPESWRCVVIHPQLEVLTDASRQQLDHFLPLATATEHAANLAAFVLACEQGNASDVRRFFADRIAEPRRSQQVKGFVAIKHAAQQAGALGASLSGSGPSVFAWCEDNAVAQQVAMAMGREWDGMGIAHQHWISGIGRAPVTLGTA